MVAEGDPTGLRIREAARAIVVSPDDHVLLVRFEFPTETVWLAPGGGLEPGESHVDALRRELHEEAGLDHVDIGPHVWNRLHIIPFVDGLWDGQRERFHLARVDERTEPAPVLSWDELRAEYVFEIRWVAIDELDTLASAPGTFLKPAGFPALLRALLRDGPPAEPLDVPI